VSGMFRDRSFKMSISTFGTFDLLVHGVARKRWGYVDLHEIFRLNGAFNQFPRRLLSIPTTRISLMENSNVLIDVLFSHGVSATGTASFIVANLSAVVVILRP